MRLRRTRDLSDYTIRAIDTDIGKVYDFYFDDEKWAIRYIAVETGTILAGRKVLISPIALRKRAWGPLHIRVNLTWQQVQSSPDIDLHKPISRQHEIQHYNHFGWPFYWVGAGPWGPQADPRSLAAAPRPKPKAGRTKASRRDAHLRSTQEVTGYHIMASDGEIGHVEDFLFDDKTWEIRYAIVDTRNWWKGRRVLIRPLWIQQITWKKREVYVRMSRDVIRRSPEWDPNQPISRTYELRLHKYYGEPPYWTRKK